MKRIQMWMLEDSRERIQGRKIEISPPLEEVKS